MVKMNLDPVVNEIRKNLQRWSPLLISLLGRVAIIKMNVLPRLLYPLQMLPNYIPVKFFKSLHSVISKFVWKGNRPRFKLEKLQLPRDKGGLALPNIMYYHWASQIRYITEWLNNDASSTFLDLENIGCEPVLSDMPFINNAISLQGINDNFIVRNTLKTWNQVRRHFGIKNQLSILAPIVCNPDFELSCLDVGFKTLNDAGIFRIQDLFSDGTLKSFSQLRTEFDLPQTQFFRYLQLRSYIHSIPTYMSGLNINPLEKTLLKASSLNKKVLSYIYSQMFVNIPTINSKISWGEDFGFHLDEGMWKKILLNAKKITCSNKFYETQYKIIHSMLPLLFEVNMTLCAHHYV